MTTTAEKTLNLTLNPETVQWPEMHYVFIEKVGPFQINAPQAWTALHALIPEIEKNNRVTGYTSLYDMETQAYRAGVSIAAEPKELPAGVRYEKFAGGKYAKFVLTGPFSLLGPATGRTVERVAELKLPLRKAFNIENYVDDPRVTPEAQLRTEILFPVEG